MPQEGIAPVSHEEILSFEEIIRLAKILVALGVKNIRLTGGEPLIRKDIVGLIESLANIKGIDEVTLTTNGILLAQCAAKLKKAGVKRINISLDTLKKERFSGITGHDSFSQVMEGLTKAEEAGFSPIKLNTVVMRGINVDEAADFVNFALSRKLILRFIEFMKVTPLWNENWFIPIEEIKEICRIRFGMEMATAIGPGPAEYYKIDGNPVGFIKTDGNNCRRCNRLRLTSTGELKLCLYEPEGLSLKEALRKGATDEEIHDIITADMRVKEFIDYKKWEPGMVYMSSVGG